MFLYSLFILLSSFDYNKTYDKKHQSRKSANAVYQPAHFLQVLYHRGDKYTGEEVL